MFKNPEYNAVKVFLLVVIAVGVGFTAYKMSGIRDSNNAGQGLVINTNTSRTSTVSPIAGRTVIQPTAEELATLNVLRPKIEKITNPIVSTLGPTEMLAFWCWMMGGTYHGYQMEGEIPAWCGDL